MILKPRPPFADTPELRAARRRAFLQGEYTCAAPDTCSNLWDVAEWCNHVRFNDPDLTGFLPRNQRSIKS